MGCPLNVFFEKSLSLDVDLQRFIRQMFFVWDNNHQLQAWMPYILRIHVDDLSWHILVDSNMLDMTKGLVQLFIAMTNMNNRIFHPTTIYLKFQLSSCLVCFASILAFFEIVIQFFSHSTGVLSLIMWSQVLCMTFFTSKALGWYPWFNLRMSSILMFTRSVRTSLERLRTFWLKKDFSIRVQG